MQYRTNKLFSHCLFCIGDCNSLELITSNVTSQIKAENTSTSMVYIERRLCLCMPKYACLMYGVGVCNIILLSVK